MRDYCDTCRFHESLCVCPKEPDPRDADHCTHHKRCGDCFSPEVVAARDAAIAALKAEIERAHALHRVTEQSRLTESLLVDKLRAELERLDAEIAALRSKLRMAEVADVTAMIEESAEMEREIAALKAELERAQSRAKTAEEAAIAECQGRHAARDELDRLKASLAHETDFANIDASREADAWESVDRLRAEVERLSNALHNVRMLANRMVRRSALEEYAGHLLRFCSDVGIVNSPLRNEESNDADE